MRKNCFFPFVHFRFVLLSQHLHLSVMAILLLASCNSLPAHHYHNHNHNYHLINLFLWFFTHNIHLTYISFVFQSTLSPNNWTWKSSWLLIIWLLILTKQKIFSMNTCSRYNKRSWRCQLWVFCSIGMIMANCSRRYWLIRLFVFWFNFLFFFSTRRSDQSWSSIEWRCCWCTATELSANATAITAITASASGGQCSGKLHQTS